MASVAIRCVRPCLCTGRALVCGEVVNVEPLVAATMLDSGRCELVRQEDRAAVNAATAADTARVLGALHVAERHREAAGWVRRAA